MRRRHWTLLILGGLAVVYACPPSQYGFYPLCPIKTLTGIACPGCGSTRALHALLHLRFVEAFALNPLFTCTAPLLLAWLARTFLQSKELHALPSRP
ncbi:MAG: DUF2752 domain-containing protein [Acidobacteria bacterium]|nr:DUF2752 domain-containing protein [Acidobacteriota bacterium]